jgi:hypothetical protein
MALGDGHRRGHPCDQPDGSRHIRCGVAILLVPAFIEWGIRAIMVRRRAAVAGASDVQNTET